MIEIDKTDKLYTYLKNLGIDNPDDLYLELGKLGRYSPKDVQTYFYASFQPSVTKELDENELERVIDYYSNLKNFKAIKKAELKTLLNEYCSHPTDELQEKILNAHLKDILYLCINYKSMHPDVDLQDLVQTANIGLIKALKKYKPAAKIDFKDYIIYWVREEIKEL